MFWFNNSNLQCTLLCKYHDFGLFLTFFGLFFEFFVFLKACLYSRKHFLTITKHWQCFWAMIVTYGVHFHVNFIILGCFWPFLGRFLLFFFFKAKITCVYSREHILTITKHLQPLCAIIVTYSIYFHVNFIVLGRFWQFFWGLFFSDHISGLLWPR